MTLVQQRLRGALYPLRWDTANGDLRTQTRDKLCARSPDTTSRTGDQDDFVFESKHISDRVVSLVVEWTIPVQSQPPVKTLDVPVFRGFLTVYEVELNTRLPCLVFKCLGGELCATVNGDADRHRRSRKRRVSSSRPPHQSSHDDGLLTPFHDPTDRSQSVSERAPIQHLVMY